MTDSKSLVPSVSIDNLLQQRDAIVGRIEKIAELVHEMTALSQAAISSDDAVPSLECRRCCGSIPDHMAPIIWRIDAAFWSYLMSQSGLRSLMDAKARAEWDRSLYETKDVPPLTRDTIRETFSALYDRRGEMFERGVVSVFRSLSWDYKTNQPHLFGKKIIIERVLDIWNASADRRYSSGPSWTGCDRLDDLLRVMLVLDGQPEQDHRQGAYHVLREHFGYVRHSEEKISLAGMISVRCYRNGNAHVVFLRPDLVEKMNEIVARWHPGALPPARGGK
jgi:hypothetical protein